jgi:hypothetical protein
MKYGLIPLIGALATGLLTVGFAGNDAGVPGAIRPPFRVVFIDQLDPQEQKRISRAKGTRSSIAALQAGLTADPALSRKLRARGIAIRDIIRREEARENRTVFYVR